MTATYETVLKAQTAKQRLQETIQPRREEAARRETYLLREEIGFLKDEICAKNLMLLIYNIAFALVAGYEAYSFLH